MDKPKIIEPPPVNLRPDGAGRELLIFGGYALAYPIIVGLFSLIIKYYPLRLIPGSHFTDDLWYLLVIKLLFLLVVPLHLYHRRGYSAGELLRFRHGRARGLLVMLMFFLAGTVVNFGHLGGIVTAVSHPDFSLAPKLLFASIVPLITAAIPEEIFYRGILQTRIEFAWGRWPGVLLSAALFSLFHLPSRLILSSGVEGTAGNVPSILMGTALPTFVAGLVFGFLWSRYRNLPALIALHYGLDFLPAVSSVLGLIR